MTERAGKNHPSGPSSAGRGGGRLLWLIPALTFAVGVALGAAVVAANRSAESPAPAAPVPSVSVATPTGSAGGGSAAATVTVPPECLQVASDSQALVDLAQQAVAAARDLNAAQLSDLVRRIDESQRTLTGHANTCKAVQGSLSTPAPSGSPG